ncbi:MAG: hypothetical protein ACLRWQ_03465 [Flavonifractor plautii]
MTTDRSEITIGFYSSSVMPRTRGVYSAELEEQNELKIKLEMQKIWRFRQEHAVHLAAGRSRGLQNQKPSKKKRRGFYVSS